MAEQNDTLGSIGVSPGQLIRPPHIPIIVSEWAALSPLVFHLASSQDDYTTVGDISLLGRFPVSLFPPLGTFSGIARLLDKGTEYLDYASTKGGSSQTVWDVKWGSVFPVANGAASASIISYKAKKSHPEVTKCHSLDGTMNKGGIAEATTVKNETQKSPQSVSKAAQNLSKKKTYRPQILNIHEFSKREVHLPHLPRSRRRNRLNAFALWQALLIILLLGLSVFFTIFGAFGTAAITLLCAVSRAVTQGITFDRPNGYLENNETHDACMLVAAHPNALEWHLFIGDRGVVDTLLNKPMILVPQGIWVDVASRWFLLAHAIQLIAMTFAAADKGWDGVCLVILLIFHYALSWFSRRDALVRDWLERENVEVDTKCFEFSGRKPLIGTVHMLSGTEVVSWMDNIIVPHYRREKWIEAIGLPEGQAIQCPGVTDDERIKIKDDAKWTREAMEIMEKALARPRDEAQPAKDTAASRSMPNV